MSNGNTTFKKVFEIFICLVIVVGGALFLFMSNRKKSSPKPQKAPVQTTSTVKYTAVGKALKKLRSTDNGYLKIDYSKKEQLLIFTATAPHYLDEIQNSIIPNQTKWFSKKIHKRVRSQFIVPKDVQQKAKAMINKQQKAEKQRYKNKQLQLIRQKQQQLNKKNQELKKQNAKNKQKQQKRLNYLKKHHKNNRSNKKRNQNQKKQKYNKKNKGNQRYRR